MESYLHIDHLRKTCITAYPNRICDCAGRMAKYAESSAAHKIAIETSMYAKSVSIMHGTGTLIKTLL